MNPEEAASGIGRRGFLKLSAGALSATLGSRFAAAAAPPYRVGVGHESDPYAATMRAINASQSWDPSQIAGRRVVIKPNLVQAATPESGTITDAQVVRAIVDLALQANAAEVIIIEASPDGAQFEACGYGFFSNYDANGRVRLVDLATEPVILAPVSRGLAYRALYMPAILFEPDTYLVSVAKLKVHNLAQATLSMKNLYGLPPIERYLSPPRRGRFAIHDRSVNAATVDMNRVCPIDFAVVDGIWGMERTGPIGGDPVRMDIVVAGDNALAVDLVCLAAMKIPVADVQHLRYAAMLGFGPAAPGDIEVRGDPMTPRAFVRTPNLPLVNYPRATPGLIVPTRGETTTVEYAVNMPCATRVEIVLATETSPALTPLRTLRNWAAQPAGSAGLVWDGFDDSGQVVPPGLYGIRVSSLGYGVNLILHAFGWVRVAG